MMKNYQVIYKIFILQLDLDTVFYLISFVNSVASDAGQPESQATEFFLLPSCCRLYVITFSIEHFKKNKGTDENNDDNAYAQ